MRVQVVLKPGAQVPLLAEHGAGRWKPCGQDWRFESPGELALPHCLAERERRLTLRFVITVTGLGSIYINFIA